MPHRVPRRARTQTTSCHDRSDPACAERAKKKDIRLEASGDLLAVPLYRYEAYTNLCIGGCGTTLPNEYWSTSGGNGTSVAGTAYDLDGEVLVWLAPQQLPNTVPLYECPSGVSTRALPAIALGVTGYLNSLSPNWQW